MTFSWEKQKTPNRPPLIVVSITTPESATRAVPSYSLNLSHRYREPSQTLQNEIFQVLIVSDMLVWVLIHRNMFCVSLKVKSDQPSPYVAHLWAVSEVPAIGRPVLPTHISWVLPKQSNFPWCVSCVPQGITQILTRACTRLHCLEEWGEKRQKFQSNVNKRHLNMNIIYTTV